MRNRRNGGHGSNQWIRFFFGSPKRVVISAVFAIFLWGIFLSARFPGIVRSVLDGFALELQPFQLIALQIGAIGLAICFFKKVVWPRKKK